MVEKKTKLAVKKVAVVNAAAKPKTSSAVTSKPKTTKRAVAATAKKVVAKKAVAKVAEPKTIKAAVVKKAATSSAKMVAPVPITEPVKGKAIPAKKALAKYTPEEHYRMVETTAYFIAERHGFQGRSDEHWAAAEFEIAAKLGQ